MIVHQDLNALHHVDHKFLRIHHTQYIAYNIEAIKKKKRTYMILFIHNSFNLFLLFKNNIF